MYFNELKELLIALEKESFFPRKNEIKKEIFFCNVQQDKQMPLFLET
jgi:hypothetical protein